MPYGNWFQQNAPAGMSNPNPTLAETAGIGQYGAGGGFTGGQVVTDPGAIMAGPIQQYMAARGLTNAGQFNQADFLQWMAEQGNPIRTTSATTTPPTATSTVGAAQGTTPPNGDYQAAFMRIMGGLPATPASLVAKEAELAAAGIRVHRNAAGVAGKVELPGGLVVDVITGAGALAAGQGTPQPWKWDTGPGGGSTPGFETGTFTGGGQYPLASVMGTGLMQPWTTPFTAPTDVTQQNDPGWQFRMREGLKAIERSAASKGTLLTGGTLKDLNAWAQQKASDEYSNVYNRALGEYQQAYGIFRNNQANQYGRLFNLSGQGLNAASQGNANNSGYMNTATNTLEGMGNVAGAGTMGSANAWANVPGSLANIFGSLGSYYATRPQAPRTGYTGSADNSWMNYNLYGGTGQ